MLPSGSSSPCLLRRGYNTQGSSCRQRGASCASAADHGQQARKGKTDGSRWINDEGMIVRARATSILKLTNYLGRRRGIGRAPCATLQLETKR